MTSLSLCVKLINALSLLLLLLSVSFTQAALFDGCDHEFNLNPGFSYLESPYYPGGYPPGSSCRYKFVAPLDYYIQANCTINVAKQGTSCTNEFFYVARDGDKQLRGSEQFCGQGSLTRTSLFRTMTVAYASYSGSGSATGNFRCLLTVSPQPCDCGWSVGPRIVNGQDAGVNEYICMVALKDITSSLDSFCGASIISHYYMVSAGHCVDIQPVAANVVAVVGDHILSKSSDSQYAALYRIIQTIQHPNYTSQPLSNDIALYRTSTPIEWSRGVGPCCLPPTGTTNTFANNYVDVIGWGTTSFGGDTSDTLQKVSLMVVENSACAQRYQGVANVTSSEICTYDSTGSGRDSCQFDSGGPVLLRSSRIFLVGIISFGKSCAYDDYAMGVNTRITSYLAFINQYTGATCNVNM